ncbi:hypothetical protein [Massilia genomosp. 1]|uniref:Phage protein n=1 Tax=Massilia genomosp. 1 TaxID=2609280 RepID=A0ABX0MIL8_9BURK|nr:hypothetical protein [Massilia genomosp. 1]NHZ62611.1 hypothetical protein [Massilia genomosp. 1]
MFNLKKLAIAATADMIVRDAAGEAQFDDTGLPLSITLHSPGSKPYQKAKHAAEERNNNRVFSRMQGKSESKQSADDKIAERAEFLASVTVSFNNFGYEDKRGYEMFKGAYGDIEIGHIADDAEKYLGDRGNFLKVSPKTSESSSGTQPG